MKIFFSEKIEVQQVFSSVHAFPCPEGKKKNFLSFLYFFDTAEGFVMDNVGLGLFMEILPPSDLAMTQNF